jgi:DNA mismatch endonuclease (patch repair protein)
VTYPQRMVDRVPKETRSRIMAAIRGRDTEPELLVRRALHREGFRFRLNVRNLPGTPDIVLPRYRVAIFVHGCFWHRHRHCRNAVMPSSRVGFWKAKFEANRRRDRRVLRCLRRLGWTPVVLWECSAQRLREDPKALHPMLPTCMRRRSRSARTVDRCP